MSSPSGSHSRHLAITPSRLVSLMPPTPIVVRLVSNPTGPKWNSLVRIHVRQLPPLEPFIATHVANAWAFKVPMGICRVSRVPILAATTLRYTLKGVVVIRLSPYILASGAPYRFKCRVKVRFEVGFVPSAAGASPAAGVVPVI